MTTPLPGDKHTSAASIEQPILLTVLSDAIHAGASDIHIEPDNDHYRIRQRIDGILHTVMWHLPMTQAQQFIARLKIMASLDIAEKRLPQDGQLSFSAGDALRSFRVSTLACREGEKMVLRLLSRAEQFSSLSSLSLPPRDRVIFQQALQQPYGLILVTGPTGSGKTQTLYCALASINEPSRNICTIEDPIEIPLTGLNQTQLNLKAGLSYPILLRALLRQDPDVIMLGEIRDDETAMMTMRAALSGHLVLSTLHTPSAVSALTRLRQMNIPEWMITDSLSLVIAQRLVRKLCLYCRQEIFPLASAGETAPREWQAIGCDQCLNGFSGRIALYEFMPITRALRQMIATKSTETELRILAQAQGFSALHQQGHHIAEQGLTTIAEITRVLGHAID